MEPYNTPDQKLQDLSNGLKDELSDLIFNLPVQQPPAKKKIEDDPNKTVESPASFPYFETEDQSGNYKEYSYHYVKKYDQIIESLKRIAVEKWPNAMICNKILDLPHQVRKLILFLGRIYYYRLY